MIEYVKFWLAKDLIPITIVVGLLMVILAAIFIWAGILRAYAVLRGIWRKLKA